MWKKVYDNGCYHLLVQALHAATMSKEGQLPPLNQYLADNGLTTTSIVVLDARIANESGQFFMGSVSILTCVPR